MKNDKTLIGIMAKPVMVVKPDGSIVYINEHGSLMIQNIFQKNSVDDIFEIDPDFGGELDSYHIEKSVSFNHLKVNVDIFRSSYEDCDDVMIYIFDNILFNKEVSDILNSIEYAVNVISADGAIEFFNNAGYTIIGLTHDDTGPGHSLIQHYDERSTVVTEPTFFKVIREKKSVIGRTTYKNGLTLFNKATPIFSRNGEIKRVLVTGQDVYENSALDEMLMLSGKTNSVPDILRFNEISQYFSNENYLVTSDDMKKVVNTALKAASSDSSVFIWGESGVGKEMIAKIIHYGSERKDKPFVAINCAAIPDELMESELFGYEQGAFTGANKFGKKGLLEEANGGTIFLDELGELPYTMQSKLLRAIQENKIRKVGGNKDIPINVRYVSATNLSKEQFLDNNILRTDLYYRLGVVPINIPPLRKRKEDIIPLIKHFLNYYNEQQGKTVVLSKKALNKLINYDWPGNIRELKNTMERTVLLADQDLVDDVEINMNLNFENMNEFDDEKNQDVVVCSTIPMSKAYEEVFNSLVKKVYKECGSIVKTAQILEIDPSTIHRKIKSGKLVL